VYRLLKLYTGLQTWWADLKDRVQEEHGATAVEYALMVALMAVLIFVAVTFLGLWARAKLHEVGDDIAAT
jgi:pilus assembly protein Flp/PilA